MPIENPPGMHSLRYLQQFVFFFLFFPCIFGRLLPEFPPKSSLYDFSRSSFLESFRSVFCFFSGSSFEYSYLNLFWIPSEAFSGIPKGFLLRFLKRFCGIPVDILVELPEEISQKKFWWNRCKNCWSNPWRNFRESSRRKTLKESQRRLLEKPSEVGIIQETPKGLPDYPVKCWR